MISSKILRGRCAFLALSVIATCAAPLPAQTYGEIRSSSLMTVKPDRMGDFQAAAKEYAAVLKKANWDKSYAVWRSLTGPTRYRLTMFTEKYADLDMAQDPKLKDVSADLTRIVARINQCQESSQRIISQILPDLSLPRGSEPPKMLRMMRSYVRSEKVNEYLALIRSDVLPAVKKSQMKVYSVSRVRYGAPSNEFVTVTALQSWSDLDGTSPIVEGMGGREKYNQFLAKITPLIISTEYDIYRYEPDLSYMPRK